MNITENQISQITVSMSQKINLGNFETRDFLTSITINKLEDQKVEEIFAFGRDLCSKEVSQYYNGIKDAMAENKGAGNTLVGEYSDKIKKKKTIEDLRSLEDDIKKLDNSVEKDLIYKIYNRKLITLDEKSKQSECD